MFLSLVIIVSLLLSFKHGYNKGFVVELFNTFSFFIIIFCVRFITPYLVKVFNNVIPSSQISINTHLYNNQINHFWYSGIVFLFLLILGLFIFRLIKKPLIFLSKIPVIHLFNKIIGGLLSFVIMYVLIFFILNVISVVPIPYLQQLIVKSPLSLLILHQTPILSTKIYYWWLN